MAKVGALRDLWRGGGFFQKWSWRDGPEMERKSARKTRQRGFRSGAGSSEIHCARLYNLPHPFSVKDVVVELTGKLEHALRSESKSTAVHQKQNNFVRVFSIH